MRSWAHRLLVLELSVDTDRGLWRGSRHSRRHSRPLTSSVRDSRKPSRVLSVESGMTPSEQRRVTLANSVRNSRLLQPRRRLKTRCCPHRKQWLMSARRKQPWADSSRTSFSQGSEKCRSQERASVSWIKPPLIYRSSSGSSVSNVQSGRSLG